MEEEPAAPATASRRSVSHNLHFSFLTRTVSIYVCICIWNSNCGVNFGFEQKRPRVLVYGKSVVDVQSPERDNSFEDFDEPRLKTSKRSRVTGEASVPEPGSYTSLIGIN